MQLIRPMLAVALAASTVVASQAGAVAKLPCKLLTDASGDAKPINTTHLYAGVVAESPVKVLPASPIPETTQGTSSDALDVTSADLAADKKRVTAVIRVKDLKLTDPAASPLGINWFMGFVADDSDFVVAAHADPTGTMTYDGAYKATAGYTFLPTGITGKVDLAKDELHISVPADVLGAHAQLKLGLKFTAIRAGAAKEVAIYDKPGVLFGGGGIFAYQFNTDVASSSKTYVAGAKNCVTLGK